MVFTIIERALRPPQLSDAAALLRSASAAAAAAAAAAGGGAASAIAAAAQAEVAARAVCAGLEWGVGGFWAGSLVLLAAAWPRMYAWPRSRPTVRVRAHRGPP